MKKNEEYSIGTGKKETGPETFQNRSLFENLMNQTNTNLKQSLIKMKKSLIKRQVLKGKVVWLEIHQKIDQKFYGRRQIEMSLKRQSQKWILL